jgi:uncharacterized membrane protein YhaH (DUF805 family)
MTWYLAVLKKYAVFDGRAGRMEYWMFFLFNLILLALTMVIDNMLKITFGNTGIGWIYMLYSLAIIIPDTAVVVRRLHDVGKSGWWYLIGLIPLAGIIWLVVLLATDSQPGTNAYGANPKSP